MKSIRTFLIVVLLAVICLVNFVAALHGYQRSMQQADQLLAQQLQQAGHLIHRLYQQQPQTTGLDGLIGEHFLFQIWHHDTLLTRSENAPLKPFAKPKSRESFSQERYYHGGQWRYEFVDIPPFYVIIAEPGSLYSTLIEAMIVDSILPIIWVLPAVAILVWLIVRRGLWPLRQLARVLQQRSDQDLRPLNDRDYPDEIRGVVAATNQLLHRLDLAFNRERRFAADAAHELRTPLAGLKVNLHNLRRRPSAEADQIDTIAALEASVDRMSHSIEQILALHRFSPEQFTANRERLDLTQLARDSIAESYLLIDKRNQTIELVGQPCFVQGDRFALATVVRNLVDNASKYTPDGGRLRVAVSADQGATQLTVEDSGPGIAASERDAVIGRFYRIGRDRNRSGVSGSGLGLSIVKSISALHDGHFELEESATLGGLCARLTMPSTATATEELPA